jgi:hypothetical protein
VCGDLAAARRVWEGALKGGAGRYADTWAAYIDFERRRGHTREARTLYKRCYRLAAGGALQGCLRDHLARLGWPRGFPALPLPPSQPSPRPPMRSRRLEEGGQAIMCDAWLRFEREEGRCAGCSQHAASQRARHSSSHQAPS